MKFALTSLICNFFTLVSFLAVWGTFMKYIPNMFGVVVGLIVAAWVALYGNILIFKLIYNERSNH